MCIISNNNNPINPDEYNYNEYKIIDYTLSSLADKINELEDKIKQNFPVIKHYFILNIVNNKFDSIEDIQNKISLLKIDFPYSFFQTILIVADKNSNSLNYNIEDTFSEYLTSKCVRHLITIENDTVIILINIPDIHYNAAEIFSQDILQNIGYTLCGSIYTDIGLLNKSYDEAKECEEYRMIDPDKKIITYDNILDYRKKEHLWNANICTAFYDAVSTKDRDRTINEFHNILISMKDSCLSHNKVIEYIITFTNHILDQYKIIGIDYDNNRRNILFQKFSTIYSFYDLENIFDDFINNLFNQIDQKKRNRNYEVVKKIKDYVDFNLLNVEMDINSIASKFYISPNYISKIFKEETSSTLIDYIIDCRLDKARELLINTDLKIEEISQTIGYSNCQYFIKIFKNKYGTTPKQYRISFFSK
jgi:two-component system response regulator YesN